MSFVGGGVKAFIAIVGLIYSTLGFSRADISEDFNRMLVDEKYLSLKEVSILKEHRIVFVPGFHAEIFNRRDRSSRVDFSFLFSDYYGYTMLHLEKQYGLRSEKVKTSSKDVEITRQRILDLFENNN